MAYVSLYRRWRPQDFDGLVGQKAVKTALANALAAGKIAHAYLFAGPRGTGKTSTARILAKALNCEKGPTAKPCGHCRNCERIAAGTSMDVLEIDAASNRGIDEIKALREQIAFLPVESRYKIYIIDEAHMLTTEASNAMLKTLEEPPAHVIFIFATTDPQKILPTIHSRCQRFDFRRVTVPDIAGHLKKVAAGSGIKAEEEALRLIAIEAEGGLRDALSLLDQCSVMSGTVTVESVREVLGVVGREALRELVGAIGRQDLSAALKLLKELLAHGKSELMVLSELMEYLRALLLYEAAPDFEEIYLTDTEAELAKLAVYFSRGRLMASEETIHNALRELRGALRPRITVELCLLDLCRREGSTLAALTARVEELEAKLASGALPAAAAIQTAPAAAKAHNAPLAPEKVKAPVPEKAPQDAAKAFKETAPLKAAATPETAGVVKETQAGKTAAAKAVPAAEALARPAPAAPALKAGAGDIKQGSAYWEQALELLLSEGKKSTVSCAKNGQVSAYSGNVLQVAFKSKWLCKRISQEDYRKLLEGALLRIARQPVRVEVVAQSDLSGSKAKAAAKAAPKKSVDTAGFPGAVRKAVDLLGGSVEVLEGGQEN